MKSEVYADITPADPVTGYPGSTEWYGVIEWDDTLDGEYWRGPARTTREEADDDLARQLAIQSQTEKPC